MAQVNLFLYLIEVHLLGSYLEVEDRFVDFAVKYVFDFGLDVDFRFAGPFAAFGQFVLQFEGAVDGILEHLEYFGHFAEN